MKAIFWEIPKDFASFITIRMKRCYRRLAARERTNVCVRVMRVKAT